MTISKVTFQVTTWLLGTLLAGNIFFIKRLVDNQDRNLEMIWQLRQDVTILKVTLDQKKELCKNLKGE